jgi:5-methylcytosine-specific restriction endonuclease McrA
MALYICVYCGHKGNKRTHHNEHPLPRSTRHSRTVHSCRECNLQKGTKSPLEYARWLLRHPDQMELGTPHWDSDREPFARHMLGLI